jgi:hypothetical protein
MKFHDYLLISLTIHIAFGKQHAPRAVMRPMSGGVAQHRNTPDNTVDTYFDFTEENYGRVSWNHRQWTCSVVHQYL